MADFVFSNSELLAAKYKLKGEKSRVLMREFSRDTGDFIVNAARGFLAGHSRRGTLARGIHRGAVARVENTYRTNIGVRGPASKYANWVEWGTGLHIDPRVGSPHLIYPRTATVMAWKETGTFATPYSGAGIHSFSARGGWNIVARFTRGQKPVHYMRDAFMLANRTYVPARLSLLGKAITR